MRDTGFSGSNLKTASDHNLRVTLQAIRLKGPVARSELATLTGLTPQAIAYISKKLLADGLIIETGRRTGGRGQPATEIAINPEGGYSIGVNIDRDHLTVLLVDLAGNVCGREHIEKNFMLPDETFDWIEASFNKLLISNNLVRDSLVGVGLAIPYKLGYLRLAITPEPYQLWRDYPSRRRLEEITGLPVIEENDATAASIGETQYGYGSRFKSFFYLFLGYGLGGGLVINGNYVSGDSGHAGEIGFVPQFGRPSSGGQIINLQNNVSLATLYAHLQKVGIDVSDPTGLGKLFDEQVKEVEDWLDGAADNIVQTLVTTICVVNPGAILIGGRLPDRMIDTLIEDLDTRIDAVRDSLPDAPPILRAQCSTDATALGAATVPLSRALFPQSDVLLKRAN